MAEKDKKGYKMAEKDKKQTREFKPEEKFIALGVVFGSVVGVLTDNIGLWMGVGVAIGAGMAHQYKRKNEDKDETKD